MWNHTQDVHGGIVGPDNGKFDYKMTVVRQYPSAMDRQVAEATRVRKLEDMDTRGEAICLNSRLDWVKTTRVNIPTAAGGRKEHPRRH